MTDFEETVLRDAYKWLFKQYPEVATTVTKQQMVEGYWQAKLN